MPSRFMSRERRTLLIISLLTLTVILLTFLETYLQGVQFSSRFITNNIIVFAVVNLNIILLMVLLLLVLRNLIKLYFERRRKIIGARFKTKLIVAFSLLSIIPAIILFVVSLNLIHKSIRNWFDIRVEESLQGMTEIAKNYYRTIGQNNLHYARLISRELADAPIPPPGGTQELADRLRARQAEYNLVLIELYDADLKKIATTALPEMKLPKNKLSRATQKALQEAFRGQEATVVDPAGKGEVIRSLVPVPAAKAAERIEMVLMIDSFVPSSLTQEVKNITSTYENYRQAKILKNPIRISYQMTLGMITLLIIFSATWFAFYLARLITVPIQKLAEGTRHVSGGDLDFKIDMTSKDELGMLINSFNRMTDDLRANKMKLESAYRRLERSNVELERRKLYIETVLDNIATGVISIDQGGRISTINMAAQAMLGLGAGERRGLPYREALQDEPFSGIRAFMDELFTKQTDRLERKVNLTHEGGQLNLLLIGSNLHDERMSSAGAVVVLENLTELINAQRIAAWREVARRIAHEIKNPLTPIKLSAQRLRKKFFQKSRDFDNVFDEGTQMIVAQVDELRRLVDEFSRFARMPSSRPAPTDIHTVMENALKLYRETFKDVTFKTVFHPEPLVAMVDPEQMKRVFVNLIDNGIEAMEGRGTIAVETTYDKNSHNLKVLIKDDGRGIPPELRDKVFSPYFSTKKEGTGLGLTIVSSIVSDHGGYIRVKNNIPRGTVFIIELPVLKGDRITA